VTTCAYFDNLKFYIFDVGGPQCHIVTSILLGRRFPCVHWHLGAKLY